ncbi:MAG: acetyl-CoA acetyltransferase, partial [Actinomycetia bacterium]|nr:acetyl-CoA acetyltransferase [Actinomycetes bacterium]
MVSSVIVSGARTPMGRLQGSLKGFSAADLGGIAIEAALSRAGVSGEQVEYVIMGQVLQAGAGQITARQAAVAGGIPMTVPAITVNKVCLSGLDAIALADQLIRAGEFEIVVAGGMESMSNAPHLLPKSREGIKYGDATLVDSMAHDGLFCAFDKLPMGLSTENHNALHAISRDEQDEFSARSHRLAAEAQKNGLFDEEIAPVSIPQRKGEPVVFATDEGIRPDTTAESLARLRPAFAQEGTITAGSSSQISDGAAAVLVMSRAKAEELGLEWIAEIGAHGVVAGPDASLHLQPANAIVKAAQREGRDPAGFDLVEINEAFAAVGVASPRALGIDPEKVNVNGGAIALGHPIGASGTRIAGHVARSLAALGPGALGVVGEGDHEAFGLIGLSYIDSPGLEDQWGSGQRGQPLGVAGEGTCRISASPWPPPPHSA